MCGSLVEFEGRRSTISLTLDIDGQARLLTVEHIFQHKLENDKPQISLSPESLASIESNIEQWDCLDDSEDDISTDSDTNSNHDDTQTDRESPTAPVDCNSPQVSHELMRVNFETLARLPRAHKQGERVEPPNTLPRRSPYLDWACLRLVNYQMAPRQRYNVLLRPGKPPGLLEDVATKPRTHAVPVFMISGILGARPGRLIELPSYLGSSKEQDLCETWTIILDQQEDTDFHPGESGSIVVDQETLKIYGHLVGSDMFGYGHVVPFSHTIKQIKTAFNAANVGFPIPGNRGSHPKGDIDNVDNDILSYLLRATWPNFSEVNSSIGSGAQLNNYDSYGETPLSRAASGQGDEIVKLLLVRGADLSMPNKHGETPLLMAVENGHLLVVKLLLSRGSEVDCKDEHNRTPLWRAMQKSRYDIVKALLEAGANTNILNKDGQTPLQWAAAKGHYGIVGLLREVDAEVDTTDGAVRVALLSVAAERGHSDRLQQLIRAGAEVNVQDKNGHLPLLLAVKYGHADIIQQLVEAGAELNVRDKDGCTPLLKAISYGRSNIIQQLVEAGAEVNARDENGCTPLLSAVQQESSACLKQLIKAGALLDSKDNQGRTALFHAVQRWTKPGVIQTLIEEGAAIDVEDNRGRTPLALAERRGVDLSMY